MKKFLTVATIITITSNFLFASNFVNSVTEIKNLQNKNFAGFKTEKIKKTTQIKNKKQKNKFQQAEHKQIKIVETFLYFNTGKYLLTKSEKQKLLQTIKQVKNELSRKNKKAYVEIKGFADERGKKFENKTLSLNRVISAAQFIKKHIPDVKLKIKAYGENATYNEDRKNRRVEVTFFLY